MSNRRKIKRIRKGDNVTIVSGRDKGKSGSVLRVLQDDERLIVQGVNVVKRHMRASQTQAGGIVEKESSIHVSNVSLVDPDSGEPLPLGQAG